MSLDAVQGRSAKILRLRRNLRGFHASYYVMSATYAVRRDRESGTLSDAGMNNALTLAWQEQYPALVRLAAFLLDEPGGAEDVVQDAYVRVALARSAPTDPLALRGYLRKAVVNMTRSALRRRKLKYRLAIMRSDAPSAEHEAWPHLAGDALVRALKDLPRRQREAIVLRYFSELSEAETADVLGISIGTVKSSTSRGLTALAESMEADRW